MMTSVVEPLGEEDFCAPRSKFHLVLQMEIATSKRHLTKKIIPELSIGLGLFGLDSNLGFEKLSNFNRAGR